MGRREGSGKRLPTKPHPHSHFCTAALIRRLKHMIDTANSIKKAKNMVTEVYTHTGP